MKTSRLHRTPDQSSSPEAKSYFFEKYTRMMKTLFFNFLTQVKAKPVTPLADMLTYMKMVMNSKWPTPGNEIA